jgi:hypothetical protein
MLTLFPLAIYPEVVELDHMIVLLLDFWGISAVSHGFCATLHSHQQYMRVPFSPDTQQHFEK